MTNQSAETAAPLKHLPLGFWLRLAMLFVLVIGGAACALLYNEWVGAAMAVSAPVFVKLSGFRDMIDKHKSELAAYKAANGRA